MPGRRNRDSSAPLDMHIHSRCSADGLSSVAEHAQRGRELGLAEMGFCEHLDLDPRDQNCLYLDAGCYGREIAAARAAVPGIHLRQGIEVTYQAGLEGRIRDWLSPRIWDYVVLSVHLVDYADGWAMVSEPGAVAAYFAGHTERQAYLPYFEELLRAVHSGLGQVLGHLDLVKRYGQAHFGRFRPAVFKDEIRVILQAAVDRSVGLEINTSGLRQFPGEPYPALEILRWYRELGGEILTVGSDAHCAGDLAAGIREGLDLAREVGFRAVAGFESGQVRWVDL